MSDFTAKNFFQVLFFALLLNTFPLFPNESKKFIFYPMLNAQGITKETAVLESKMLYRVLESLSLEMISDGKITLEHIPERIPSFKKLSLEAKDKGADYFIWSSIRLSGDKSYRNIYIVETSSNITVESFSLECLKEICNSEEREELKQKIISFCQLKSIPFKERELMEEPEKKQTNLETEKQNPTPKEAFLSILFPGLGQNALGRTGKSYFFFGGFTFCLILYSSQKEFSQTEHRKSIQMYQSGFFSFHQNQPLFTSFFLYEGKHYSKESEIWSSSSKDWLTLAAGIYLFNLYDAFFISSDTKLSIQLNPSFKNLTGNFRQTPSNFSIAFTKEIDL
jgi:hypothetical protein